MKIKLNFKYLAEVEVIFTLLNTETMSTGNAKYDQLLNSILHDMNIKFYKKLHAKNLRTISLKVHEALALITLYNYSQCNNIYVINKINQIYPKLN